MTDFDRLADRLRRSVQKYASIPMEYRRGGILLAGVSRGVFTREYVTLSLDSDGNQVASTSPMIEVDLDAFAPHAGPARDDIVSIRSGAEVYRVAEVEPDGYGSARLILRLPDEEG